MEVSDPSAFRANVSAMLEPRLGLGPNPARNLERGVFNATLKAAGEKGVVKRWDNPGFRRMYTDRLRSVYRNLTADEVVAPVRSGKIQAHRIAFMTHQELRPSRWDSLLQEKRARDACMYEPQIDANTDNFECRKCGSNRCSYYQLQTRSADEAMTTFVTCINCGNRWKC